MSQACLSVSLGDENVLLPLKVQASDAMLKFIWSCRIHPEISDNLQSRGAA